MKNWEVFSMSQLVIFVVPFHKPAVAQFLQPLMALEGVQTALITQDPVYHFSASVQERVPMVRVDEITDVEALLAAARQLQKHFGKPHRILAINEQIQVPVAQVREAMEVDGMSSATITNFRDKALMKERFLEAGVPCARHVAVHDKQTARDFIEEVGFPVCLKPIDGAAAQATFKVESPDILEEILHASAPTAQRPVQLEEFVAGEESSFETLSVRGEHLWHSLTHYDPTPLNVVANPWIQWRILSPVDIDAPRYDDIREASYKALTCLGMETGLTHLEWFRREDGSIAVNEVAARPPGAEITTLMNRAHDVDLFNVWAHMMVRDELLPIPPRQYATGAAYLRGLGGARVNGVHGMDVLEDLGEMVTDVSLPQVGQPASNSYEGEGFVIVRHPETERVAEALREITDRVRVEMI
jgi:biotin carboxylase